MQTEVRKSASYWPAPHGFLKEPKTSSSGVAPPTVSWAHPRQPLIKEVLQRFAHMLIYRSIFSVEVPSSQMTQKLTRTILNKQISISNGNSDLE